MSTPKPSTLSSTISSNECGTVSFAGLAPIEHASGRPEPIPPDIVERVIVGVREHLTPDGVLLNLYIWGSRFYMNHSTNSDYDLVAIVTGYLQPKVSNVINIGEDIDVALCERSYFEILLADHVPWAVAFAYYPPAGIVFETIKLEHKQLWRQHKRALTINSHVNLNQAAVMWRNGEEYRSRKRVFFVMQMTIFATQLALTGTIYDFWDEPNALRPILFDPNMNSWATFSAVWRKMYDKLVDRYVAIRNAYRIREIEMLCSLKEGHAYDPKKVSKSILQLHMEDVLMPQASSTLSAEIQHLHPNCHTLGPPLISIYIKEYGLHSLERDMAITYTRHPKFQHLLHLSRTATLTPVDSIIGSEAYGIILDSSDDQYLPVAWSHHRYYKTNEEGPAIISYSDSNQPVRALRNPDGILVMLFHYGGEWQLSSVQSPDASERSYQDCPFTIAELFWISWQSSPANLMKLDTSVCYSFWLIHPLARNRLLAPEPKILIEGATRWTLTGCVDIALQTLISLFPFGVIEEHVHRSPIKSLADINKNVPLGGLILQQGNDRCTRMYVPCSYMTRLDTIASLQNDHLLQEIEMVHFLIEQYGNDSAWNYPLPESMSIFQLVSPRVKNLIEMLEKYRLSLPTIDQLDLKVEAEALGPVGHFLFLMKAARTQYPSAADFLRLGNPRRVTKYLATWWTYSNSTHSPGDRKSLQYSYK